ncbi:MAG: hypothetical protein ABR514_11895 [Chthoniobacterales bacterium]
MTTLLQILPQAPGSFDGVGDYAIGLAKALSADHGYETVFAVTRPNETTARDQFRIIEGLDSALDSAASFDHVILHYANYGYQSRGVPFRLRRFARELRKKIRGRWITTFHELYAFGPPWQSAFWLYPLQARVAHDMIDLADSCFVSSDVIEHAIHAHDPQKPVHLVPVMSNFGEPANLNWNLKSPRRWVICGGTQLILRSLRSFVGVQPMIPRTFLPEQLDVVGGRESDAVRDRVRLMKRNLRDVTCRYYPEITASAASDILRQCAFAWIDYFGAGKTWPGMILKSGSFAACCAHGVVPLVSHDQPPAVPGDPFPGWYFITPHTARFPELEDVAAVGEKLHAWYHRHASAACLARAYAERLAS